MKCLSQRGAFAFGVLTNNCSGPAFPPDVLVCEPTIRHRHPFVAAWNVRPNIQADKNGTPAPILFIAHLFTFYTCAYSFHYWIISFRSLSLSLSLHAYLSRVLTRLPVTVCTAPHWIADDGTLSEEEFCRFFADDVMTKEELSAMFGKIDTGTFWIVVKLNLIYHKIQMHPQSQVSRGRRMCLCLVVFLLCAVLFSLLAIPLLLHPSTADTCVRCLTFCNVTLRNKPLWLHPTFDH